MSGDEIQALGLFAEKYRAQLKKSIIALAKLNDSFYHYRNGSMDVVDALPAVTEANQVLSNYYTNEGIPVELQDE